MSDEHQLLHDVAQTETMLDRLDGMRTGSPAPPPGQAEAVEAQRQMEETLESERTAMFDRLQAADIRQLDPKYDRQRLDAGLTLMEKPGVELGQKRILAEHLSDIIRRLGGVEIRKRGVQL